MLRRWIAGVLVACAVGSCAISYLERAKSAEPMGSRAAQLRFWLYDSTGYRLAMSDTDTVYAYIAQGDTAGTTFYAKKSLADTSWIFAVPETTDIYTISYRNPMHSYVLIDSFPFPGRFAALGSIPLGALLEASVPESAIVAGAVCPRHMNPESTFTMTIGDSSTVNLSALPTSLLGEWEFGAWFSAMLRDTLPAWLDDSTDMVGTAASLFPAYVDSSMCGAVTWGFVAGDTTQTVWKSGASTGDLIMCGWAGHPQRDDDKYLLGLSGHVTAAKKVILHRQATNASCGEEDAWFIVIGKP